MSEAVSVQQTSPVKTCQACQVEKPLPEFNRHAARADGRDSTCRSCNAVRGKEWYRRRQESTNRLHSTYMAMRQRCHYPKHEHYATYGGRGIRVCAAWLESFDTFRAWAMAAGYRPGLQLDRIDNDRGYDPKNCRFVTPSENARNKRKRDRPLRNNPRLKEDQVRQVRSLLAAGVSQREIGRRLGVTHGTVGAIKRGQTWTDVL